ncbi:outer membrane beta-barrel protein [Xanthomonas cannabis]|uniref:outer membrane beta-barrel protein n=1 Tax=Xanthomonas cannabis TaxID=1885674 RepID=UPI00141BC9D7|nr:outer membrane beta-barrel protein [Xanthomonas cannabis]NIK19804.1 hypothetical protein [Xanthomonas cannabis]
MRTTLILAALLAAAPFAASAEGLSYSYVEGGWNRTEISVNEDSDDLDGGYIRGSWQIAEPVYVFAGYQRGSKDYRFATGFGRDINVDVTLQQATAGIGYRQEMTERVDFVADLSVLRTKVEAETKQDGTRIFPTSSADSNFGMVNLGLRGKPSPRTEAWIKAGYIDGSDVDEGEFVGTLGGQVNFTTTWGLVGEVEFIDNANQYRVGVRASF